MDSCAGQAKADFIVRPCWAGGWAASAQDRGSTSSWEGPFVREALRVDIIAASVTNSNQYTNLTLPAPTHILHCLFAPSSVQTTESSLLPLPFAGSRKFFQAEASVCKSPCWWMRRKIGLPACVCDQGLTSSNGHNGTPGTSA